MYSRCGRFGNLAIAKNIGPHPRTTWGSPYFWPSLTSANRTRTVIDPKKQSKHLARRQQQSLWGPRSSGAASYSNAAGLKVWQMGVRGRRPKDGSLCCRGIFVTSILRCTEVTTVGVDFSLVTQYRTPSWHDPVFGTSIIVHAETA
jgi:hypothetical protein